MLRASPMQKWTRGLLMASLAALGAAGLAPSARADVVLFNPNGGGAVGALPVASFDEKVGNSLSQASVTAINATPIGGTTAPFFTLYQASMSVLLGATGNTLAAPGTPGVNQITVVAGFFETATRVSATTVTLSNAGVNETGSFVEIYSNPTVTSNDLTGTGFRDGALILKGGDVTGTETGSFTSSGTDPALDHFGANNYPAIATLIGSGGTQLTFQVTDSASNYFVTPVSTFTVAFNTSNVVPFNQADPSLMFYTSPDTGGALGAAGRAVSSPPGAAPNYTHNLGATNGLSGPDFQFQSDANSSFSPVGVVPEPGTISAALIGIGFASLAGLRAARRRRDQTSAV